MKLLMGKRILLSRSADENQALKQTLTDLGCETVSLPLIDIVPNFSRKAQQALESQLPEFDGFIFISINAAIYGVGLLHENQLVLKNDSQIIAVGPRTAKELSATFSHVLCPEEGVGAKKLLATAEMQQVEGMQFLIIRGRNGNPLLGTELENRGAKVVYYDCYARRRPRTLQHDLARLFSDSMFDVCFLHSVHAAINLMESSGWLGQKISSTVAIVGSQAIKDGLIDYGWKGKIFVAKTPANTDMLKCFVAADI